MARNKVMQLWTAFVTAFLALCTALGLVTTAAATAAAAPVPQTEAARNTSAPLAVPAAMSLWAWSHAKSLPPTMKQRIHAEAHGKSPSCRHLPLTDTEDAMAAQTDSCAEGAEGANEAEGVEGTHGAPAVHAGRADHADHADHAGLAGHEDHAPHAEPLHR